MSRVEHKTWCAALTYNGVGAVPVCDCAGKRISSAPWTSDTTIMIGEGRVSLGDGNYWRAPLPGDY